MNSTPEAAFDDWFSATHGGTEIVEDDDIPEEDLFDDPESF